MKAKCIAAAKNAKNPAVYFTDFIAKVFASTHATDLHRTRGRRSHGWSGWIAPPRERIALQEPSKKHLTRRLALSTRFRAWLARFTSVAHKYLQTAAVLMLVVVVPV